jgi:hypothetical protein
MPRGNTVTSAMYADLSRITCVLQSSPNDVDFEFYCYMTMLGPILPVQLLQQSKICPSSVFHIHRTRRTLALVTSKSSDHSKRRRESRLSGPTKGCRRRCMSGYTLSQKTFFLEVFQHFRSAGILVWNAMETFRNYVIVYLMCSIN